MLPPWYEVGEAGAVAVLGALVSLRLWVLIDRGSRAAANLRRKLSLPGAWNVIWIVAGLCVYFIAAEAVLDFEPGELLPRLDAVIRDAGRVLASVPAVHSAARRLSDLAGTGLVTAIASAALCLSVLGHRREALMLLAGSLSAWVLSGVLKLVFAVPRPASSVPGFPSGHAVVALVAPGLLAWSLARYASPSGRRALYIGAGAVAILAGASRIILDAHWLSDVIGGLAAGAVWLNLVILVARPYRCKEAGPPS